MRIAQVSNFLVTALYNLTSIPPEFQESLGDIYHVLESFQQDVDIGWRYEGGDFLPPLDTSSNFGRIITVLAYRSRFTPSERTAIQYASRANTLQGASIAAMLEDLMAAGYIHLDRPDTISGTQAMESAGLLGLGRAAAILSPPVYSAELPSEARKLYGLPAIPTTNELSKNGGKGYTTVGEFQADNPTFN